MKYIKRILIILLITNCHFYIFSQDTTLKIDNSIKINGLAQKEDKIRELIISKEKTQYEIKEIGDSLKTLELEKSLIQKKQALSEIDFLLKKLIELEKERAKRKRISKINLLLIILISVLLMLSLIIVLYLREKVVRKTAIQELYKTKQLVLSRQLNPHFIHNSLGAIQNFVFKEDKIEANKYITLLSELIRKIFESSQKEIITIKEEIEMLEEYLKIELMRFNNRFKYSIKLDDEIVNNKISPSFLQPIVENSIWHGLMHKDGDGEVKIEIKKENKNRIKCIIEDNGIGREKSREMNKTKQILKKSNGIELTKKRLELLNAVNHDNSSSFKVIDLKNEDGESTGTLTVIIIPLI